MQRDDELSVLFVARTFPPSTGGMQAFSSNLLEGLEARDDTAVTALTWGGGKRWLPLILPYLGIRIILHLLLDDIDVVYGTDGVVAPLTLIGKLFSSRSAVTLHGLDITFDNALYRILVVPTFRWQDAVVCVSRATARTAVDAGVPARRITVIPNGVDPGEYERDGTGKDDLRDAVDAVGDATVLLSVGRLVERKGFHWFVDSVMPELGDDYIYLVCGAGPMEEAIRDRIEEHGLEDRVHLPGHVGSDMLRTCYNAADALVMPNVPVDGDMEGFGIVAVEAASCGTPVIAADMEGMQDAVIDGENGIRVAPEDADAFVEGIEAALEMDRDAVRSSTVETFGWERQAERYKNVLSEGTA